MKKTLLIISFLFCVIIVFNCSNTEQTEIEKGKLAFDSKHYKTAVEYFKKALKENYKNSEAYLLIGRSYLEMEGSNYNSAIDYINKSLKYNPNNPEAFVFLGDAYQARYSDQINADEWLQLYLRQGLLPVSDKAIEYYQKAINLNSFYALPYFRLGVSYGFRKNDYDEAIKFFKKGISIDDHYTRVYLNLGELYFLKNDVKEAIYYIKKEIDRNPNLLDSYFKIANCYIKAGNYSDAIDYLNILAKKDPNYEGLNYRFGIAYQNINKEKSIEYMKIAARLGDTNAKEWLKKQKLNW